MPAFLQRPMSVETLSTLSKTLPLWRKTKQTKNSLSFFKRVETPNSLKIYIIFVGTVAFRIFIYHPIILGRLAVHVVLNCSNHGKNDRKKCSMFPKLHGLVRTKVLTGR